MAKDPLLANPAVVIYRDVAHLCPNHIQRESISVIVRNERVWRSVVHEWLNSGWNPRNVEGMLKRYALQAGNGFKPIPASNGRLPEGVSVWRCICGFKVVQGQNGIKDCPECQMTLTT